MSFAHTMLIGAALIAAAVLFTNRSPPAEAEPGGAVANAGQSER